MKIRVKETGEILTIVEYDRVKVDHCDSYGTPLEFGYDEVEFIQDETLEDIDWEAYRRELIKAALQGLCANSGGMLNNIPEDVVANRAIEQADAVIEKLKAE